MRKINKIIVHCSDTPEGRNDDVSDIDRWHRAKGWNGCGYNYVIKLDGTIQVGREENVKGAHCKGNNSTSIGICYIGGKDKDTRTTEQKIALVYLIGYLKRKYPKSEAYGHRDFSSKACPQFDAFTEYKGI